MGSKTSQHFYLSNFDFSDQNFGTFIFESIPLGADSLRFDYGLKAISGIHIKLKKLSVKQTKFIGIVQVPADEKPVFYFVTVCC